MVYIEVLAIVVPILVFIALWILLKITLFIDRRRYKESNDKGRQFKRPENTGFGKGFSSLPGTIKSEECGSLQTPGFNIKTTGFNVEATGSSGVEPDKTSTRKVRFGRRKE